MSGENLEVATIARGLQTKLTRVSDIFEALMSAPPTIECWPEWMERATALLSQLQNLMRDVRQDLWRYVVIPGSVAGLESVEDIPNVQLRTRLGPQVEEHVEKLAVGEGQIKSPEAAIRAIVHVLSDFATSLTEEASRPPSTVLSPTSMASEDPDLIAAIKVLYAGSA